MVERGGVEGGSSKEGKRVIGYTVTCFCSTHVGWSHHITAEVTAKLVSRELGVFSLCVRHRKGGASRRSVPHTYTHHYHKSQAFATPRMACVHVVGSLCVYMHKHTHTHAHTHLTCISMSHHHEGTVSNPSAALMHSLEGGGRGREREGGGRGREREGGGKRRGKEEKGRHTL